MLERADELREAFVELGQDEAVERNAGVQQPEKCDRRHQRDARVTNRNDIVFARLPFEDRALAEPGIGGKGRKGHGLSGVGQVFSLDQFVNHADPDVGRIVLAAHIIAGLKLADEDRGARTLQLFG